MKRLAWFLLLAAPLAAQVPPARGAFIYSGGSWIAAATAATGSPLTQAPPAVALYCFNGTNWVPADSSCLGGGVAAVWGSITGTLSSQTDLINKIASPGAIAPTSVTATTSVNAPVVTSGTPTSGATSALPTGSHGLSCDESSTAGVPAVGVDYQRCDSITHEFVYSCNGSAESPIPCGGANVGLVAPGVPTYSSPAGGIISGTSVTATCPYGTFYYNITGSAPVLTANPFTVSAAETVNGECWSPGYNPSFASATYSLLSPPVFVAEVATYTASSVTSITSPSIGVGTGNIVVVACGVNDGSSTHFTVTSTTVTTGAWTYGTFNLKAGDGSVQMATALATNSATGTFTCNNASTGPYMAIGVISYAPTSSNTLNSEAVSTTVSGGFLSVPLNTSARTLNVMCGLQSGGSGVSAGVIGGQTANWRLNNFIFCEDAPTAGAISSGTATIAYTGSPSWAVNAVMSINY